MFASPKVEALAMGTLSAVTGFVGWLVTATPSVQSGIIATLIDACPVTWRPGVGAATKALSAVSLVWALYQSSHSGPTAPPVPPTGVNIGPTTRLP